MEEELLRLKKRIQDKEEKKQQLIARYEFFIGNLLKTSKPDQKVDLLEGRKAIILAQIRLLRCKNKNAKSESFQPSLTLQQKSTIVSNGFQIP